MALKFAANLSFAFQEHENFLQRYQAAKNAGSVNGCVNLKKIDTRKKSSRAKKLVKFLCKLKSRRKCDGI